MAPRVLISDKLSPLAQTVFEGRGVDIDIKVGLERDELIEIIGDEYVLAVRSATLPNVFSLSSPLANVENQHVQPCPRDESQKQQNRQKHQAADYQK